MSRNYTNQLANLVKFVEHNILTSDDLSYESNEEVIAIINKQTGLGVSPQQDYANKNTQAKKLTNAIARDLSGKLRFLREIVKPSGDASMHLTPVFGSKKKVSKIEVNKMLDDILEKKISTKKTRATKKS